MEEFLKQLLQQQQQQLQLLQQQQLQQAEVLSALGRQLEARQVSSATPSFPRFEAAKESWNSYLARLNQHFEFHGVKEERNKKAFFLSISGSDTYELLQKLFPLRMVEDIKFSELVQKLNGYYNKEPHIVAARYKFFQSRHKTGMAHAEWITNLKGLSRDCAFNCECGKSYSESLIRDMIIQHTNVEKVRIEALQFNDPTLSKVQKIATMYDITAKTAEEMMEVSEIMAVQSKKTEKEELKEKKRELKSCKGCGVSHSRSNCRYSQAKCYCCGKIGHIQTVCMKKGNGKDFVGREPKTKMQVNMVNEVIGVSEAASIHVEMQIANKVVKFQLDTGSPVSLVNLATYAKIGAPSIAKSNLRLCSYGKEKIDIKGTLVASITYKGVSRSVPITVVNRVDTANIMGMDMFNAFQFQIEDRVNLISEQIPFGKVEALQQQFQELFQETLGCAEEFETHIQLKDGALPKYCKARPVPIALREQVSKELLRLQKEKIITPVKTSAWATPLVVVKKPDGSIRLCGDFKATVNPQLQIERYPIPRPEELFQKLAGGIHFSKIDLRDAYLQLPLNEESKQCLTVNTQLGLFKYERLPFGIASAAPIFQRFLEQLIAGIPGAMNYLDDIVVTGRSNEEHIQNLQRVLSTLQAAGLKAKWKKCEFFKSEITYLGHVIDQTGIRPTQANVEAIINLPAPRDIKQLQSFLGKANYYAKFIKNFSSVGAPLNALRRKNVKFQWSEECQTALDSIKKDLISATKLHHFEPNKVVVLATDASDYGIGAVISQKDAQGIEHPVAFASKTLNVHQRRYSQIEKEALSIIFGVRKFNEYLFGNKFIIQTDHKPLVDLFHPAKKIPDNTVRKLQRWALFLSDYNYKIEFRRTTQHGNADALSRLPAGPDESFDETELECLQIDQQQEETLQQFPLDQRAIAAATDADDELAAIRHYLRAKHNTTQDLSDNKFWKWKDQMSVRAGVLLLETNQQLRVVMPSSLRPRALELLHQGHWGIVFTKQLARKYCYWPGIDKDIENKVRMCQACQAFQKSPKCSFKEWPEPKEAWERIHIDFAGPFQNSMWLVIVDAKSGYPFVVPMNKCTSESTISALQRVFSIEGLPTTLVSDNGPQFVSEEFEKFCQLNGIQHVRAPPFHPRSNGEAERFVQTFKTTMLKAKFSKTAQEKALLELLTSYRALPSRGGVSPAQMLHGRQPRTLLSLFLPKEERFVRGKSKFAVGEKVLMKTNGLMPKWIPAIVIKTEGAKCYTVRTKLRTTRRHEEQLRKRFFTVEDLDQENNEIDSRFQDCSQFWKEQLKREAEPAAQEIRHPPLNTPEEAQLEQPQLDLPPQQSQAQLNPEEGSIVERHPQEKRPFPEEPQQEQKEPTVSTPVQKRRRSERIKKQLNRYCESLVGRIAVTANWWREARPEHGPSDSAAQRSATGEAGASAAARGYGGQATRAVAGE